MFINWEGELWVGSLCSFFTVRWIFFYLWGLLIWPGHKSIVGCMVHRDGLPFTLYFSFLSDILQSMKVFILMKFTWPIIYRLLYTFVLPWLWNHCPDQGQAGLQLLFLWRHSSLFPVRSLIPFRLFFVYGGREGFDWWFYMRFLIVPALCVRDYCFTIIDLSTNFDNQIDSQTLNSESSSIC